ncbi:MAG: branched-chain amino acid aminotransferase, partial [Bacteroidota bacterium]
ERHGVPLMEKRISISEMYSADEVFVTGSMGELTPVLNIDGRVIGNGEVGKKTRDFIGWYKELTENNGIQIPRE